MLKKILTFFYPHYSLQTLDQFYRRVDEFTQCLRAKSCSELAEKIEVAFNKGSVGSEIIGDIGLALHEIMPKVPRELIPMAKELRHFVRWYRVIMELE